MNMRRALRPLLALTAVGAIALTAATPVGARGPAAAAALEQRSGMLVEAHGDHIHVSCAHGTGDVSYSMQMSDGRMVSLESVPRDIARGLVGRQVVVRGTDRGGKFDLTGGSLAAADGKAPTASADTVQPAIAPGVKTVAVLLINFADDMREPWTLTQARNVVFDGATSVNAFYQDSSDGAISLSGEAFGYITITRASTTTCDWQQWSSTARQQAINSGIALGNYTYTVYAWPNTSGCGWAGLGYLPGTSSYIDGYLDTRVVGHELGHNFGVHHAATMSCTGTDGLPSAVTGTCSMSEYGDGFSIMGSSSRLQNGWHKAQLGWLSGAVVTASTTTTQVIAPLESGSGVRMVRVPRGNGTYLWIDFRQPTGLFDNFTAGSAIVSGVSLRIAPETTSLVQSQLIDVTPTSPTSFGDSTLKAGMSFTDPLTGVTISVLSVSASGAEVSIDYGADTVAPSAPTGLTATPTAASLTASTSEVVLNWNASTDNRGVAGYRVYTDGSLTATTANRTFTVTGLTPSTTYTFGVEAFDAAGNASSRSTVTVTTPTPDVNAPSAVSTLSPLVNKSRQVTLRWNASVDPEGSVVTYVISRSGRTWTTTSLSTIDKPGRGTFTYTIYARDAAGNATASVTVTVTVR
ncbi:MAG: fibronectin type III domain-containing protein [Ilumatobacteraceae bacterium]